MCFLTKHPVLWIASLTFIFGPNTAGTQPKEEQNEKNNDASSQSYLVDVLRILSSDNFTEQHQNQSRRIIRMLFERTMCPQRVHGLQEDCNLVSTPSSKRKWDILVFFSSVSPSSTKMNLWFFSPLIYLYIIWLSEDTVPFRRHLYFTSLHKFFFFLKKRSEQMPHGRFYKDTA